MSHRPFEEWLLSDVPRSADMERLLEQHLASCERCRALAGAWAQVEARLKQAQEHAPRPGFAARWRRRYQAEQLRLRRRQPWAVLAAFSAAGLPLAVVVLVRTLALLRSPAYLALHGIEALGILVARLYSLLGIVEVVRDASRAANPAVLAVALVATVGLAGALWLATVYRFAVQGVGR